MTIHNASFDCKDCTLMLPTVKGRPYPHCLRTGTSCIWERAGTLPGATEHGKNCGPAGTFFDRKMK